jgi:DNA-binding PadR family transcriptional regulator/DNA-binding CsgD family transcriptional regulator
MCLAHIETVPTRPSRPLPITDPAELASALEDVEPRDRRVVELRYGLEDGQFHSRVEIGRMLGISRERVRQLEGRAIERLSERVGKRPTTRTTRPRNAPRRRRSQAPAPSRHSFLRSWTLVLLWLQPAHVYELRARLQELGLPAATYRMLQALEREGYLLSHWAPGRGAGPNRRVYSLTPRGVEQLHADAPALAKMVETLQRFLDDADLSGGTQVLRREPPG